MENCIFSEKTENKNIFKCNLGQFAGSPNIGNCLICQLSKDKEVDSKETEEHKNYFNSLPNKVKVEINRKKSICEECPKIKSCGDLHVSCSQYNGNLSLLGNECPKNAWDEKENEDTNIKKTVLIEDNEETIVIKNDKEEKIRKIKEEFKQPLNTKKNVKSKIHVSSHKDKFDDSQARFGRERHEGLKIGKFLQAPPMFFTADHHVLPIMDTYRGRSVFLVCGGPSFKDINTDILSKPNIMTMGINNSVRSFRPNLWCCVDSPDHFIRSVWLDATIQKFVPICHTQKPIFNNDKWEWTGLKVSDCPNMVYYKRNEHFRAKQFLFEDTMNWGSHKQYGGGRSVMLPALKILFYLGFRKVFLLGCDFNMSKDAEQNYHFSQARSNSSINGNNSTYKKNMQRFEELRPLFEREKYYVYNCNENSSLKAFDHIPFDEAIGIADEEWGNINVDNERTEGLYDTKDKNKRSSTT